MSDFETMMYSNPNFDSIAEDWKGRGEDYKEDNTIVYGSNKIVFDFFKGFLIVCGGIIFCYLSGYSVLFLWSF